MDITKLSLLELKALAYDIIVKQQALQNDLNLVNTEIGMKTKETENGANKTDTN